MKISSSNLLGGKIPISSEMASLPLKPVCAFHRLSKARWCLKRLNPLHALRAAGEKSRQSSTSCSHSGRELLTGKYQPISEGISWEPRIIRSPTGPQKIVKGISFHVTTNDMMVTEQV